MSVSRIVTIFTPLFAALSGYIATQALKLPGAPQLDAGELTIVFVAGATAAGGAVVTWLSNRGKHERQQLELDAAAAREAAWAEQPEAEPEPAATLEDAKKVLGLTALEADVARALAGVRSHDEQIDRILRGFPEIADGIVAAAERRR